VLFCAVLAEGVKAVRRWIPKVVERLRTIEEPELGQGALLDIRRQLAAALAVPDALSFAI